MSAAGFIANQCRASSSAHISFGVALAFFYYSFLITDGSFDLFQTAPREIVSGVVFNNMLSHLLQGDFSIDPDAIRQEAFVKDGKTYTYFGVGLALLRLPLLPFKNFATIDITPLSVVIATCIAAYFKCASLLLIRRLGNENPMQTTLYGLLVISVLIGGPQIQFLKAVIYQEVLCWEMALSSAFIYVALRGLFLPSRFSTRVLVTLAFLAGLALLTRVTGGISLYVALGLLLVSLGTRAYWSAPSGPAIRGDGDKPSSIPQWLISRQVMLPVLILAVFAALVATVNYGRWGNPFVFVDMHFNPIMMESGRIAVIDRYGEFDLRRIPFSVIYYFFPITLFAAYPYEHFPFHHYDGVEPPLGSFLFSDPANLLLAVTFFLALIRNNVPPELDRRHVTALLFGFLAPVLLMLSYFFLAFRFRGEFYPLLEFAAMLGFFVVSRSSLWASRSAGWRFEKAVSYSVIIGICASHVMLIAYKATEWT